MSKAILPKSVLALSSLAAAEHSRFGATRCVLVTAKDGNFRAEATNGHLLGIINGYAEGEIDVLIDARKFAEIKKVIDKDDDRIVIETKDRMFSAGGLKPMKFAVGGAPIPDPEPVSKIGGDAPPKDEVGRWPNTNQVIPTGKIAAQFSVDADYLIDMLRCAKSVCSGETCSVKFTIFRDRGDIKVPIALTARSEDGCQFFDGVLVPIVPTK